MNKQTIVRAIAFKLGTSLDDSEKILDQYVESCKALEFPGSADPEPSEQTDPLWAIVAAVERIAVASEANAGALQRLADSFK